MARTVTDLPRPHENIEMSIFGYLVAGLLFLLMIPLLPFFAVYWVIDKITSTEEEGRELDYEGPSEASTPR